MASAVGGGVLSSVLALEVPALFRWTRDLYILPAFAGAGIVTLVWLTGILNGVTVVGAAASAIGLRLLSIYFGWHTPRAYVWRNPFAGMRQQILPSDHTQVINLAYLSADSDLTAAFPRPSFHQNTPADFQQWAPRWRPPEHDRDATSPTDS